MKRILLFVISLIAIIACSPEASQHNPEQTEDIFFVRYIGAAYHIDMATYTNEEGKQISLTYPSTENGVFERIIGPVYIGFKCSFSMDTGTGTKTPIRIEVKRNNEPFVVKAEGNDSISYTIE